MKPSTEDRESAMRQLVLHAGTALTNSGYYEDDYDDPLRSLRSARSRYERAATNPARLDVFEDISSGYLNAIDQAWRPVYRLKHALYGKKNEDYVNVPAGDAVDYGDKVWQRVTASGFTREILVEGDTATVVYDPMKHDPVQIRMFLDDKHGVQEMKQWLQQFNVKLNPRLLEGEKVPDGFGSFREQTDQVPELVGLLTPEDFRKIDFGEPYNSIPEGNPEDYYDNTVNPDFDKWCKSTGVRVNYRVVVNNLRKAYGAVTGELRFETLVNVPADFFKWLDGSLDDPRKANKFPFTLASDFSRQGELGYGSDIPWPPAFASPTRTKKSLDSVQDIPGFQPRVNSKGWCITPNGGLFKPAGLKGTSNVVHGDLLIEREEKLDALSAEISRLRVAGDTSSPDTLSKITDLEKQLAAVKEGYNGRVMVVDWVNDKVFRYTTEGKESVDDLVGARALDAVTEARFLDMNLTANRIKGSIGSVVAKIDNWITTVEREDINNDPKLTPAEADRLMYYGSPRSREPEGMGLSNCLQQLLSFRNIPLKALAGVDVDNVFEDQPNGAMGARYAKRIASAFQRAYKADVDEVLDGWSDANRTGMYGWLFETLGSLSQRGYDDLRREATTDSERNVAQDKRRGDHTKIKLPNVTVRDGAFEALMPHQVDTFDVLKQHPKHAFLDISPGGGKTVILSVDAIKSLADGTAKRPLVVTTAELIPQFITEVNAVTNGRINAVPLRPNVIADVIRQQKLKGWRDFVKWVHSFPINTVFFCAYTDFSSSRVFFDDLDIYAEYGSVVRATYQYRQLIAACGFDYVAADESTFAKNPASNRAQGTASAMSRAEYTRPASGTLLNNTVVDLWGQTRMMVNGAVFGTIEEFSSAYAVMNGIITSSDKAVDLRKDLRRHAAVITKRKSDWAYLMPNFLSSFHQCKLTSKQTDYYNRLMTEAELEIRRELDKLKASGLTGDELEAKIMSILQHRLQTVEQFLVAPDVNKDFTHPKDEDGKLLPDLPSGDDLVSPEVRTADEIIDAHIASGRKDKVLVFGYHKVWSAHFMKHSKHAKRFLRYTAGDQDTIEKFKKSGKDATIVGMVADINGMKVGQNCQVAGRVLASQAMWSPGDWEQAISRMYRPDPRGIYNREVVNLDWIMPLNDKGEATLAVAKAARMMSKAISNALVSNADDATWLRIAPTFDNLPLLSMNLELVFDFKMTDAVGYFAGWNRLQDYENTQMQAKRRQVAERLESIHGVKLLDDNGRVKDVKEFLKLALVPVEDVGDMPGSRRVHTPWIDNAQPPDPHNLGLVLVQDQIEVQPGDVVMTEFGPGEVVGTRNDKQGNLSSLRVKTAVGVGNFSVQQVAATDLPEGKKQLRRMFQNLGKYAVIPRGVKTDPSVVKQAPASVAPTEIKRAPTLVVKPQETEEDVHDDADNPDELNLKVGVINGLPALYTKDEAKWLRNVSSEWVWVDPFVAVDFSSWRGANDFLADLVDAFFMDQTTYDRLLRGADDMKRGRSLRADRLPNPSIMKNFFLDTHKKLGKVEGLAVAKPYWISQGHGVRLVFSEKSHDPAVRQWLAKTGKSISGVRKVSRSNGLWINFFRSAKEAARDAKLVVDYAAKKNIPVDRKRINEELVGANEVITTMRRNSGSSGAEREKK